MKTWYTKKKKKKVGKNLFKLHSCFNGKKKSLFFSILITSKIKKKIIFQTNNH